MNISHNRIDIEISLRYNKYKYNGIKIPFVVDAHFLKDDFV